MKKRAEIATGTILAIVVSIIGIALLTSLSYNGIKKSDAFYCKTFSKFSEKAQADERCLEYYFEQSRIYKEEQTIAVFESGNNQHFFDFSEAPNSRATTLLLPKDADIMSADLSFSGWNEEKILEFSDSSTSVDLYLGMPITVYVDVPSSKIISNAILTIKGKEVPPHVDLVFVIDSSKSMGEEWNAVCLNRDAITDNLTGSGITVSNTIYKIGNDFMGPADCVDGMIEHEQIKSVLPEGTELCLEENDLCGSVGIINGQSVFIEQDDPDEAWAPASSWASLYHPWNLNAKKLLFPVSDSDPTGGTDDAPFSDMHPGFNNEEETIDKAKLDAKGADIRIFPIYGDENTTSKEGYGVGCGGQCCDAPLETALKCDRIMGWMEELAEYTGGNVSGYNNKDKMLNDILEASKSKFPENVSVSIDGQEVFYNIGIFNTSEIIASEEFLNAINHYLLANPGEPVPITVSSGSGEGSAELYNLKLVYEEEITNYEIIVNGQSVKYIPSSIKGETFELEFREAVMNALSECTTLLCQVDITVSSQSEGLVIFSDLTLEYEKYNVRDALFEKILDCWKKSNNGRLNKKLFCEEIALPKNFEFIQPIKKSDILERITERNIAHLFNEENINFPLPITGTTNILIEYNPELQAVSVS